MKTVGGYVGEALLLQAGAFCSGFELQVHTAEVRRGGFVGRHFFQVSFIF
ncbi:MAG: hypothetical protein JWM59_3537 [Verrucomicrobiales bacterium]|nr:hypothetical protein [Verrucomicrobiales bacterium]